MKYTIMLKFVLLVLAYCCFQFSYGFDPKIYTFAFTGIEPGSKFNGTDIVGARVELMKEICCRAGKRCDAAFVDFLRCWNKNTLVSEVLNGRWYDVCIELSNKFRRQARYAYSDIVFFDIPYPAIVVKPDSKLTLDDLRNPRNNLTAVHMANPYYSSIGLLPLFRRNFFVKNVIDAAPNVGPNRMVDEVIKILNDPCSGADFGLLVLHLVKPNSNIKVLHQIPKYLGQASMMVRKDEQHILDWWDFTLKRFMCSSDFPKFCAKMDKMFGANPLNCPYTSQVDCNDCTIKQRVPGCDCPAMT